MHRNGRLAEAAHRYSYALKKVPCLEAEVEASNSHNLKLFGQLRTHLLLNLSRTLRRQCNYPEAIARATEALDQLPQTPNLAPAQAEALMARAKAKYEMALCEKSRSNAWANLLSEVLDDGREALRLRPRDISLHRFIAEVRAISSGREDSTVAIIESEV